VTLASFGAAQALTVGVVVRVDVGKANSPAPPPAAVVVAVDWPVALTGGVSDRRETPPTPRSLSDFNGDAALVRTRWSSWVPLPALRVMPSLKSWCVPDIPAGLDWKAENVPVPTTGSSNPGSLNFGAAGPDEEVELTLTWSMKTVLSPPSGLSPTNVM